MEVVLITSHANTDERKDLLKSCIDEVKKMGYKVIVSSHIPIDDIIDEVDYFTYSKDNPVLTYKDYNKYKFNVFLYWTRQNEYQFSIPFELNHGYAVFRLIIDAVHLAKLNNYEKIHIINYDYIIKDIDLLKSHNDLLNDNDVVSYNWCNITEVISSALFSAKTDFLLQSMNNIRTIDDYFSYCHTAVFEEFLFVLFQRNSAKINHISDLNSLREKNIIDEVHLSVNKPIKKTGENLLLFPTHVDSLIGKYFLIQPFDPNPVYMIIKIRDSEYSVVLTNYKPNIVEVNVTDLESGIRFIIPDYNYDRTFDLNSNIGSCTADPKIIYTFDQFIIDSQ
jgi:hypothetical protein